MYIYVASSWRNEYQDILIPLLEGVGYEVYDFKNPSPGNHGFHWSQVMPNYTGSELAKPKQYLDALLHPIAESGFIADFAAMQKADVFICLLPCGKSAHLEMGWAIGQGKRTAFLSPEDIDIQPELMYKLADRIFLGSHSFHPLLDWLKDADK